MPLRDHFRPPLDNLRHWEAMLSGWPVMIIASLRRRLPRPYFAEPIVHSGGSAEIDVATFEQEDGEPDIDLFQVPPPNVSSKIDLPAQDVYEVLVYDEKRQCRLVAAIELVSPANKDRPEHRREFVAKCAGLLRERVSVIVVDIVTTRTQNMYFELLDRLGLTDPRGEAVASLCAVACRLTKLAKDWQLEAWTHSLSIGQALPTMPLWLADNLAILLDLEESYEQSCGILNIP